MNEELPLTKKDEILMNVAGVGVALLVFGFIGLMIYMTIK